MLSQIASEKTLETSVRAVSPSAPAVRLHLIDGRGPKTLARLSAADCRFCVADAAEGEMHLALFCAAPIEGNGPYCETHRRLCRRPAPGDEDLLLAEVEAALARRP